MKRSDFAFYACVIAVCVAIAYLLTRCGSEDPSGAITNSDENYVVLHQTTTPDDSARKVVIVSTDDSVKEITSTSSEDSVREVTVASADDSRPKVTNSRHKGQTASNASASRNEKSSKKSRNSADNATKTTPDLREHENNSSAEENQSSPPLGDAQNDSTANVPSQTDDDAEGSAVDSNLVSNISEAPINAVPENEEGEEDSENYDEDETTGIADGLLNDVLNDVLSEDSENASGLVEYDGMIGHIVYDTARVWKRTVQPYYQLITFGGEKKTKKVAEIYCIFLSNSYEFNKTSYFADRDMEIEEQGSAHVSLIQKNDIVIAKIFVCEKGWRVIEIIKNLSR